MDSIGNSAFHGTRWFDVQSDGLVYLDNWLLGYKGGELSGTIDISAGTRGIAGSALNGCSNITSVTIPSSVIKIGPSAFHDCTKLSSISSFIKEPFEINEDVFQYYDKYRFKDVFTSATLYVPKGTKEKYEATEGWNQFTTIEEVEVGDQIKGDVNGDQTVDVADIASVISVMADSVGTDPVSARNADVNGDGVVDVADIATIISVMAAEARLQDR